MTLLGFSGLINTLTCIILGIFVLLKNIKNTQNISYFVLNFCVALFSFGYFFWQLSNDIVTALIWFKILTVGIILINSAYLFFVFVFVDILDKKKPLLITCLVINIIFIILNFNNLLYTTLTPKYNMGFWPIPTFLFSIYLAFWTWQCLYGFYWLIKGRNIAEGRRKEQIRYFIVAAIFGFVGGATNWPMWYGIHIPPYPNILISVYIGIVAYAIVRHQLMNIEVVIKKTLVFASLFTAAFGIFVGITLLTQELIAGGRLIGLAISSIVIILAVRPLEDFLTKITDKFLFQKKYDYKELLKIFTDEVLTVLDKDVLVHTTVDRLSNITKIESCGLLLHDKAKRRYDLVASVGTDKNWRNISLDSDHRLISFLEKTKTFLYTKAQNNASLSKLHADDKASRLKIELAIPLIIHEDMIGVLLMGKKKSDEDYTQDDMDILIPLSKTLGIAISNAIVLEELGKMQVEAAQREKMAVIGTLAAGINHEIGNPLNIINTKMQIYQMSLQRGLYKNKKPEDIIEESNEIMCTCLKQTARISDITKKLSSFAKPSKEFKPEPTDVEEQVDEMLSIIGHELELERIAIKKDIQKPLPRILADKRQVQQVFFNIIRNAAQAIKEKGTIIIKAYSDSEKAGKIVKIKISDTGHGIPEDKIDKIFDPFFTTKEPNQGTGLGLAIVRQLIWRNKGDIKVASKSGAGTTFTITFPQAGAK